MTNFIWNWNGSGVSVYDTGLVLMANFDNVASLGETGSVITDVSMYNNPGYVNSAIRSSVGKYNGSLLFNGAQFDYFSTLTNNTSKQLYTISYAAWFNLLATQPSMTYAPILSLYNGANLFAYELLYYPSTQKVGCMMQIA